MNVDIHTHCIPGEFIELARKNPVKYQVRIEKNSQGEEVIYHDQGYAYPLYPGFYDLKVRLADMDRRRIHLDCISVSPTIYYYWAEASLAAEIARICNDSIARMCLAHPQRLQGRHASCQELSDRHLAGGNRQYRWGGSREANGKDQGLLGLYDRLFENRTGS